jgi:flavorubredoxin
MPHVELAAGVYWVGAVDWDARRFHGLTTPRGTTYNSYLIVDEKTVLIDGVRAPQADIHREHIAAIADPASIDYVISNHAEPDHSGNLETIMAAAPKARLLATKDGVKRLEHIYHGGWNVRAVEDGEELDIGRRSLRFIHAPLLHWPETMFTYDPASATLFSCDAFGAHIASTQRFADQLGCQAVLAETKKYFAFLICAYRKALLQAMAKLEPLEINTVAPSHGPCWRGGDVGLLLENCASWARLEPEEKAVIAFASMWGATRRMVGAAAEGVAAAGLPVRVYDLERSDLSEIIADAFNSRLVLLASPTFESGIYPPVEAFIPYLRVPRIKGMHVGCLGSFGWGGGSVPKLIGLLEAEGHQVYQPALTNRFFPDAEGLQACRDFGRGAAEWARAAEQKRFGSA